MDPMNHPIRLIVTDLDNTLLRQDRSISAYTQSVFSRCKAEGLVIAFATARSECACRRFAEIILPDAMIIDGGAIALAGEETVYRAAMSPETTNGLLRMLLAIPDVRYITVETGGGYFVNRPIDEKDPRWLEYMPPRYMDFTRGFDGGAYKITVDMPDRNAARTVADHFPAVEMIPYSDEEWFRFADKNADKWNGVQALAAHMGIQPVQIAAFGDDYNDREMLRQCGVGVAVANAIDEVKAVADAVCRACDEDGVAGWIEEHILLAD